VAKLVVESRYNSLRARLVMAIARDSQPLAMVGVSPYMLQMLSDVVKGCRRKESWEYKPKYSSVRRPGQEKKQRLAIVES
jgi:hypothetical protein